MPRALNQVCDKGMTQPRLRNPATPMAEPQHYVYTALPPQCIRVLELHPGLSDMVLVCRVVVQQITDKPYEAISYVWATPLPPLP